MNWTDIFKFFISVSGISAIIIYIGKKLIDKSLDAGIEKYKITLNKELELFKSELSKTNTEHQIKYNKLYEQRGEKIQLIYTLIYKLEKKLRFLTTVFQGPEWSTDATRSVEVRNHLLELEETIELNRIYFSDDFSKKIEFIVKESKEVLAKINQAKLLDKNKIYNPTENPIETWAAADDYVQTEMYQARMELVKEFHRMIGVK